MHLLLPFDIFNIIGFVQVKQRHTKKNRDSGKMATQFLLKRIRSNCSFASIYMNAIAWWRRNPKRCRERRLFTVLMRWDLFWLCFQSTALIHFNASLRFVRIGNILLLFFFFNAHRKSEVSLFYRSIHLTWWFGLSFDSSTHLGHVMLFIFAYRLTKHIQWFGSLIIILHSTFENMQWTVAQTHTHTHNKTKARTSICDVVRFIRYTFHLYVYPFDAFVDSAAESWFRIKTNQNKTKTYKTNHEEAKSIPHFN